VRDNIVLKMYTVSQDVSGNSTTERSALTGPVGKTTTKALRETRLSAATKVADGLEIVLKHHGCPANVLSDFVTKLTLHLVDIVDEATFVREVKFILAYPMARFLRTATPAPPTEFSFTWTGRFRRWFRSRLTYCRKNVHLWWSFLQAKRSAAPVSDEFVVAAFQKHRAQMQEEDPIDDEALDSVLAHLEPILARLNRAVLEGTELDLRETESEIALRELADDISQSVPVRRELAPTDHRGLLWVGSTNSIHGAAASASFERTRSAGGQSGYLRDVAPSTSTTLPLLGGFRYVLNGIVDGRRVRNKLVPWYFYESLDFLREVMAQSRKDLMVEALPAQIAGVVEPLKVRVISKGPSAPYYLSKFLQRELWSKLKQLPCFSLIAQPISSTHICDVASNPVLTGEGSLEYFSVDYSAATDGLSAKLSEHILARIMLGSRASQWDMWSKVLKPHLCHYKAARDPKLTPVQQRNGQLMGSILSFPILCLANLGLYLWVIEQDTRSLSEKLKGVLINGDDMLYRAPHGLWDRHVSLGQRVGLIMTPGKAYSHERFAGMNSQCYDVSSYIDVPTPVRIPFLNTGLYQVQKKVMRTATIDDEDAAEANPISVFDAFVQGGWGREGKLLLAKQFIRRNGAAMAKFSAGRNWFLHQSLGGCGATPPEGFKWSVNDTQRKLAHSLLNKSGELTTWRLVGPATEMQARLATKTLSTRVHAPWGDVVDAEESDNFVNWRQIRRYPSRLWWAKHRLVSGFTWAA